ncbi:hypothetical protein [Streptomyces sp. YIM S03343]
MQPPLGTCVVDTRTGRVGFVMGHEGPYIQLRPYGGGLEWDAEPAALRDATAAERRDAASVREGEEDGGADGGAWGPAAVGENGRHEPVPRRRHRAAHPETG